jgi:oxygen-dependent protoporphyrinogen oxidase
MSARSVDVVVIGAGIAGLVAAYQLKQAGLSVACVEAGAEPGGHARTTAEPDGAVWEWGPNSVTSTAHTVLDLAEALGLDEELVNPGGPGTRYIFRGGVMHALPHGPLGLLTCRVMSLGGWLRLFAEPFVRGAPVEGESVSAFFTRRLGPEAARVLVGSFVSGIHAGDPDQLGVADAFPSVARWERESGSVVRGALASRRQPKGQGPPRKKRRGLWTFRRGLGAFTGALAARLGDDLALSAPVDAVVREADGWAVRSGERAWRAPQVVIATPPQHAAPLLRPVAPAAADALGAMPLSPVAVVQLLGTGREGLPQGFGALVPRGEGVRTLGVLFVGNHVPGRMPEDRWVLTCFLGGATDPGLLDLSDDEIVTIAKADVRTVTGFDAAAAEARVVRHRAAIPQMRHGHLQRVADARAALAATPGLHLAGNYVFGVSVEHAASSGAEAAAAVLAAREEAAACA